MTPDRIAETHAVTVAIESRIAVLWKQRQRDRIRADWSPARHDREVELRALLRLLHVGRRLARESVERADPVTAAMSWHDWQSNAEAQAIR